MGLALVTLSRPVWAYGLEAFEEILPKKEGRVRRVAFAQLALPGAYPDIEAAMKQPEDELGRLSRAIPLWFAETFYFSPAYSPIAALGCFHEADGAKRPAIFPTDWTVENLGQLVDTTDRRAGLHLHGLAPARGRGARRSSCASGRSRSCASASRSRSAGRRRRADAELKKLHEYVRAYMEWAPYPEGSGIPYSPPSSATAWLDVLGVPAEPLPGREEPPPAGPAAAISSPIFDAFAPHAFSPPASSLAWISLRSRATSLGLAPNLTDVLLSRHPAVVRARKLIEA